MSIACTYTVVKDSLAIISTIASFGKKKNEKEKRKQYGINHVCKTAKEMHYARYLIRVFWKKIVKNRILTTFT